MAFDRRFGLYWRRTRRLTGPSDAQSEPESPRSRPLVQCDCGGDAVAVIDADECHDGEHWLMILRCGACDEQRSVVASSDELDELLNQVQRDALRLMADAEFLWRARTAEEIETFVEALERGLIGPDDFER